MLQHELVHHTHPFRTTGVLYPDRIAVAPKGAKPGRKGPGKATGKPGFKEKSP